MKLLLAISLLLAINFSACNRPLRLRSGNIDKVIEQLTLQQKAHLVVGTSLHGSTDSLDNIIIAQAGKLVEGSAGTSYPIEQFGIPAIVFADGPMGVRIAPLRKNDTLNTYYCTGFPIGTLIASSWDEELATKVGRAIGEEAKEYGIDVMLAPGVNIQRNPLCGRNFEYYSEDPLLAGIIGAATVNGIESTDVGTSVKHFAANNQEINRLACDSRVSERALREIYLRQFELIVRLSQPKTIMTSYNYLNGLYTSENRQLLTDVLRGDWGFEGMVISDWGGGKDAVAQITAGNDMLQPGSMSQYRAIVKAVENGTLDEEDLNRSVKRVLQTVVSSPRFKGYKHTDKPDLEEHDSLVRCVAAEGMVLLQNRQHTLPLTTNSEVALFGTASYDLVADGTGAGHVNTAFTVELPQALQQAGFTLNQTVDSTYTQHIANENKRLSAENDRRGWWFGRLRADDMPSVEAQAAIAAESADAAIITIGRLSGEGTDRHTDDDFYLKAAERTMIEQVCEAFHQAGKPVVVVLNVGGVVETASWRELPDAILIAWQAGQQGGNAISDIISGKVNPSGCLPMSFPMSYNDVPSQNFPALNMNTGRNDSFYRYFDQKVYEVENVDYTNYTEDIFVGYRHYTTHNVPTAYPFGFGLSYSSFTMSAPQAVETKKGVNVKVEITNNGELPGRLVVQLYVSAPTARYAKPVRELRAFAKSRLLKQGESQTMVMQIDKADLASFDQERSAWVTDSGTYTIYAAHNADDTTRQTTITLHKPLVRKVSNSLKTEGELFINQTKE